MRELCSVERYFRFIALSIIHQPTVNLRYQGTSTRVSKALLGPHKYVNNVVAADTTAKESQFRPDFMLQQNISFTTRGH